MIHIASDLVNKASRDPGALLLIDQNGERYSYAEILKRASGLTEYLKSKGCGVGDRVILLLPNGVEYLVAYYGVLMAGATVVALSTTLSVPQLEAIIDSCAPQHILPGTGFEGTVEEAGLPFIHPASWERLRGTETELSGGGESIAQIIFTSGTTGQPKGVMLSHRAIAANTSSINEYLALSADDRVGVVLDFVHSYGNSLLQTHVRAGGSLALLGKMTFPAHVTGLLDKRDCTGFSGVPSTFALMLRHGQLEKYSFRRLRYMTCAGGGLPPSNVQRLMERLPGKALFLMYGQTEASARLSFLPPEVLDDKLGSIGRGIPGVTLELLDKNGDPPKPGEEGEIVASGENLMSGYWQDEDATRSVLRDGRLWTGDLAKMDEDGFFFITGRKSDLVKSGGYRIHPVEVENALTGMPGIHECVVVGVPDPTWGEVLVACFTDGSKPEMSAVRSHLRGRLPDNKWPRVLVSVDEVPRTVSGKPRRKELRLTVCEILGIATEA